MTSSRPAGGWRISWRYRLPNVAHRFGVRGAAMIDRTSVWLGASSGSHTSKKFRTAYWSLRTPRGGRRTVPMRRPSPRSRGVPSRTIRTAIWWSLPELSDRGELSRNGRSCAHVPDRGVGPPQLPSLLLRAGYLAHRLLDAVGGARLARPGPHQLGVRRRPEPGPPLARCPAVHAVRRHRGRPRGQAPPHRAHPGAPDGGGDRARRARPGQGDRGVAGDGPGARVRSRQRLRHSRAPGVPRGAGGQAGPGERHRPQFLDVQRGIEGDGAHGVSYLAVIWGLVAMRLPPFE